MKTRALCLLSVMLSLCMAVSAAVADVSIHPVEDTGVAQHETAGEAAESESTDSLVKELHTKLAKLAEKNEQLVHEAKLAQNEATQLAQKNEQLEAQLSRRTQHDAGKSLSPQPKAARLGDGGGGKQGFLAGRRRRRTAPITSCPTNKPNERLAVTKFELDGQGKPKEGSESGICLDALMDGAGDLVKKVSHGNHNPSIVCKWSKCTNGDSGMTACSRVCLVGGTMTMDTLDRTDGNTLEAKYKSDSPAFSSPVCIFHKVVLCTKPAEFDASKCAGTTTEEGDPTRCEACQVKKTLDCHAIVPTGFDGTSYDGFTDICNHVKEPCAQAARYL